MTNGDSGTEHLAYVYEREDERGGPLSQALTELGWRAQPMGRALDAWLTTGGDLWVVDLDAVTTDPFGFLQSLATIRPSAPLLLVTRPSVLAGRREEFARLPALWPEPLDVLIRPYLPEELALRVAQLRVHQQREHPSGGPYDIGALHLDVVRHLARYDGREVHLTRSEFLVLQTLVEADGGVVSREELLRCLYGPETDRDESAVEPHVSRLRQKLVALGMDPRAVRALHGVGYRLDVDRLTAPES